MIKDFETSFHQPVEISFDSLAAVASFQLVPKYILKVKVISKCFTLKKLFSWKKGAKGQSSLMQFIECNRRIVQRLQS